MPNSKHTFAILTIFILVFIYLLVDIDVPSITTSIDVPSIGVSDVEVETETPFTGVDPEPVLNCYDQFIQKSNQKSAEVGSVPWLDDNNVRLICSVLHSELSVLEWGCGGSTVFFSRFVKKWICIEHVPGWGTKVQGFLQSEPHRDRVTVVTVKPSEFYNADIPAGSNNDGTYEQFREYIEYPASLGETFGLIIDDGRARVEAAESAIRNKLLEENGLLIIHDWERPHYHKVLHRGFRIFMEDKISMRQLVILQPETSSSNPA